MKKTPALCIFLTLLFINAPCLQAEVPSTGSGQVQTAPVPGEQARHSDDLGQSSTVLAIQVRTYDQLVSAIRQARVASQARVEQAVQQEKVREAWETGKLIDEHILQHRERADYADQTIIRLAKDLGTSETELRYMLQFARTYPIYRTSDELTWGHYESLLALNDGKERDEVAALASREKWSVKKLREEVKKRKAAAKGTGSAAAGGVPVPVEENTLTAKPGKVGTYRIVKATAGPEAGKQVIDLGFSNYYRTSRDLGFKEGTLIEIIPGAAGGSSPNDKIKLSKRTSADLYTYRAHVVRVLDGDTAEVVVDLGFGVRSVQTLRLRGLDCPELVSKEGKEAKEFVEKVLGSPSQHPVLEGAQHRVFPGRSILIKTTKSDKYDRYLADIFFVDAEGREVYLNNLLLEKGHAVRVRE